ncbi:MAG TPA: Uma2 family endonuclease [Candidatus Xenobia bacterium]|jgi:Uma2 family endonuclease
MSVAHQEAPKTSPGVYLALERQSSDKHEYFDGVILNMPGGSPEHDLIAGNLYVLLYNHVGDGPCTAFTSNMKVRTERAGLFSYPDLTIVCGEPRYHDSHRDVLTNPKVVFEVLSPSTADFDRGGKRIKYQSIKSLSDYLLVSQDVPRVEHWSRGSKGVWLVAAVEDIKGQVHVKALDCTLRLTDIYRRIKFGAPNR